MKEQNLLSGQKQPNKYWQRLPDNEIYLRDWILGEYGTFQDTVIRRPYFLEGVYNQKRLHSMLGYRPPNECEEVLLNQENNESIRLAPLTLSVSVQL
jgi:hypothetical protein